MLKELEWSFAMKMGRSRALCVKGELPGRHTGAATTVAPPSLRSQAKVLFLWPGQDHPGPP